MAIKVRTKTRQAQYYSTPAVHRDALDRIRRHFLKKWHLTSVTRLEPPTLKYQGRNIQMVLPCKTPPDITGGKHFLNVKVTTNIPTIPFQRPSSCGNAPSLLNSPSLSRRACVVPDTYDLGFSWSSRELFPSKQRSLSVRKQQEHQLIPAPQPDWNNWNPRTKKKQKKKCLTRNPLKQSS